MAVDSDKLNQFIGKFLGDVGAAAHGASILIGEQLGLYRALSASGPLSSEGLAAKAGIPGTLRSRVAGGPSRLGIR